MLAAARRGAHPLDLLRQPDTALIDGWSRAAGVLHRHARPRAPRRARADRRAGRTRRRRGDRAHRLHGRASSPPRVAAGATYVTHLFNAMRPFAHRDPGPIGATLADDSVVAGLICDGIHVDPVAVRMAWRALGPDRLNLVTDAVAALGSEPGDVAGSGRSTSPSARRASAPRAACSPAATCRSTAPCATSSRFTGLRRARSRARPSPRPRPGCSASPIGGRSSPAPAPT